jgi:hypothetical protein
MVQIMSKKVPNLNKNQLPESINQKKIKTVLERTFRKIKEARRGPTLAERKSVSKKPKKYRIISFRSKRASLSNSEV